MHACGKFSTNSLKFSSRNLATLVNRRSREWGTFKMFVKYLEKMLTLVEKGLNTTTQALSSSVETFKKRCDYRWISLLTDRIKGLR